MKLGLQDVEWGYVGARLANCGDDEQSEFFKAFIKECLSWGTRYQVGIQLAGVNHKLTPEEREVLSQLSYEENEHVKL